MTLGTTPPRPLCAADQRDGFDCGREAPNSWFRRHAWRNQENNTSRTNIVCDPTSGTIVGFVSLSAGQIEREFLPRPAQRNSPNPLPIILLGQLAVDVRYQGQGYSRSLLRFALAISVRLSRDIGCFGVVTHPLDDGVRQFYQRYGFQDLPFDPRRSMIVRTIDLLQNGF